MGRIYNALDRFLPFDRFLDPMFGGQPGAPSIPGRPPMMGAAPGASSGMTGFAAAPEAGPPRVAAGDKRVPKFSRLRVLDGVLGGLTFTDAIDAERARTAALAAAQEERDQIASYVSQFPPERQPEIMLAIKANPKAFGEAIFTPRVVGEAAYTPSGFQMPGMSDAQRAGAAKPIPTEGGAYVPMAGTNGVPTGYQFRGAPQIVKSGVDENITEITPGGAPPMVARSPEVGQFIKGQLEGIPGLRLGSAEPRSEREIASLSLSAPNTYHRQGAALDFTAPGQNPDEVIAAVRSRMGAGYDVIYHPENGSFHVEPGPQWSPPGGSDGARVISRGSAKPKWRQEGDLQYSPDGKVELVPQRQLPSAALKAEEEDVAAVSTASSLNNMLGGYIKQIDEGALNFGPVQNLASQGALMAGMASPKDRNFASFRAGLERLRNESLRLNTGVQTNDDAIRAWNELISNLNDEGFVRQRLAEIQGYNQRALQERQARLETRRAQYGLQPYGQQAPAPQRPPLSAGAATPPPPRRDAPAAKPAAATPPRKDAGTAASAPPVKVRTVQEAEQLPPNTRFVLPDGRSGTKR
jgi:hypothetical protein